MTLFHFTGDAGTVVENSTGLVNLIFTIIITNMENSARGLMPNLFHGKLISNS